MARFVMLPVLPKGELTPVNPDLVCYVKPGARAVLVFGAVLGGLHELAIDMGVEDALAALTPVSGPPEPPAAG